MNIQPQNSGPCLPAAILLIPIFFSPIGCGGCDNSSSQPQPNWGKAGDQFEVMITLPEEGGEIPIGKPFKCTVKAVGIAGESPPTQAAATIRRKGVICGNAGLELVRGGAPDKGNQYVFEGELELRAGSPPGKYEIGSQVVTVEVVPPPSENESPKFNHQTFKSGDISVTAKQSGSTGGDEGK